YKLNNPCQHYAVAAIINKELNAKNCNIKKGDYSCYVNFTEITRSFFGDSFFYGEYMIKATVNSKKGNIMCLIMNYVVGKKTPEKNMKT
ncbi:uncharacterized protein, partial [Battus philenor]|uniref:uncharacterized protein n=1 Tax=Battus philenor TaxID=42288 RepID=UPI0035CFD70E